MWGGVGVFTHASRTAHPSRSFSEKKDMPMTESVTGSISTSTRARHGRSFTHAAYIIVTVRCHCVPLLGYLYLPELPPSRVKGM